MKYVLILLTLLAVHTAGAQEAIFIRDKVTNEPVPFVKVIPDVGAPQLADIDGRFNLFPEMHRLELRMAGYRDTVIDLGSFTGTEIYIMPVVQEIGEVKAVAGENPAHRIIDLAIANRKRNNPTDNDAFRYNSYSKFLFDVNREALYAIPDSLGDSTVIRMKKFFDEQYLFLIESASTRTFIPPSRDKEEITAYKVSGFTDPMFSTFATEMQSFSFYENQFNLLGKTYINPIAFGGTKRYLFILEDTTVINRDTTFTIFYRPRKGKNFEGMTGRLYINSNGWAIEKVTASPYEDTTGTRIQIVQEYEIVDGKKWFPVKLSTEIAFPATISVEGLEIIGKGNTYIQDIQLNPVDLRKGDFSNVTVTTAEDAGEIKDETWDTIRKYNITEREKRTYEMIDSLSQAENLEQKLMGLSSLAEGKVPLGYVNLDLTRLIDFNLYERYRFGAGLETSKKLMKWATIGGYFAWSTGDKTYKYGGYSTIHLYRKAGLKLDLRYQQDLLERGGYAFQKDVFNLNANSNFRHFFIQNMERQRLAEAALSVNVLPNMKLTLLGNYQRIWYTKDYQFYPDSSSLYAIDNGLDIAEVGAEITWNIGEKVMMLGDRRISKGTRYPKIRVKAVKGLNDLFDAQYDYFRLNAEIQQDFQIRGLGKLQLTAAAAQTIGDVPLFLMQVGNGTAMNWTISVSNTFETMLPSEFYHQRQASFFTRLELYPIKTKAKWNEPQFCFHHGIGYGDMTNKGLHNVQFRSMDKGFFEGGLILNNLYTSGIAGIGIAGFYRYGYYANDDWKKNIVPKITVTFNL